jgi:hypothetical protein
MAATRLVPTRRDADLAEILARLERIEKLLLLQRPRRRTQCFVGTELLGAIHQSIGIVAFCTGDVMVRVGRDESLRAAFESQRIRTAADLGIRLRAMSGKAMDGFRLVRLGRERHGALWSIERM